MLKLSTKSKAPARRMSKREEREVRSLIRRLDPWHVSGLLDLLKNDWKGESAIPRDKRRGLALIRRRANEMKAAAVAAAARAGGAA